MDGAVADAGLEPAHHASRSFQYLATLLPVLHDVAGCLKADLDSLQEMEKVVNNSIPMKERRKSFAKVSESPLFHSLILLSKHLVHPDPEVSLGSITPKNQTESAAERTSQHDSKNPNPCTDCKRQNKKVCRAYHIICLKVQATQTVHRTGSAW